MKKLVLTDIALNVGLPIKEGTLQHLQEAYTEIVDAVSRALVGEGYDPAEFYILYGCENSDTAPDYIISAGAIFHNGEIYLVSAATFTAAGTAVGTITETNFTDAIADPVTFTDGVARNVHLIRKIVFADGVSGSGDVDFADLLPLVAAPDTWHEVGDVGEPAFENGWVNADVSLNQLRFKKFEDNTLMILGVLDVTTVGSAPTIYQIFTLPVGWRPAKSATFFVNLPGTGILVASFDQTNNKVSVVLPSTGTFTDIAMLIRIPMD